MRSHCLATLLVLAVVGIASAAEQSEDPSTIVTDCKRLVGVAFEDLDGKEAISTCLSAIRIDPEDFQLHALLGRGYLKTGQDEKALQHVQFGAENGDSRATTLLGYMYKVGRGVPVDDREAVRLFRRAADGGDAYGMHELGMMYKLGRGVSQDYDEAVRLFREAEKRGNPRASISMGTMYKFGLGVQRDDSEAVRRYRKAAESGTAYAMGFLAIMYLQGRGVLQDDAEAVRWLRKATVKGNGGAMGVLGGLYLEGRGVSQDYREAVRLFRQSADKGLPRSMYWLGVMYETGKGVAKNSKIAAHHAFRSLKTGDKFAARKLAANPDGWSKAFYLELQLLLKNDGVYSGQVDGRFGPDLQVSFDALQQEYYAGAE